MYSYIYGGFVGTLPDALFSKRACDNNNIIYITTAIFVQSYLILVSYANKFN